MPNLFKIEFVQGKTDASDYGQVKHSLVEWFTNLDNTFKVLIPTLLLATAAWYKLSVA